MKKAYLAIFETEINGKLARVEIPTVKDPMNSRTVRGDLEAVARQSFKRLAPAFHANVHRIKCVELLTVSEPDTLEELGDLETPKELS